MKKFVKEIAPLYENVVVQFIPGRNPDLFFKNAAGDTVSKVDLSGLTTEECVQELESRGFQLKPVEEEFVEIYNEL